MRNGHKLNQKHIRKVGGSSGSEVYKSTEGNKTIITYGECNISPSKFECDFKCGGWGALAQSSVTFTVQGYKNNSWVTIFEKKGTRPVETSSYTVFNGTNNYESNDIFTDFKVLFKSTDNESYVYAKFRVY